MRKTKAQKKKPKHVRFDRPDQVQLEMLVSGAARAEKLARETWSRSEELPPVVLSAIFRELVLEIRGVHGCGQYLAERFIGSAKAA